MSDVEFGVVAAAADEAGVPDRDMYRTMLDYCEYGQELGFTSAWALEHHFSNYFPVPSPTVLLGHIAARFPDLAVGTCVLVLPWYQPLRLAGELAMLAQLTDQDIHIGLGRGTAVYEFERFSLDMADSTRLFVDGARILKTALEGGVFEYHGDTLEVPKPTELRPRLDPSQRSRIHLYGSATSVDSSRRVGEIGIGPIHTATGSASQFHAGLLNEWAGSAKAHGHGDTGPKPIMIKTIVEPTDDLAMEKARKYVPMYFQAQLAHYTPTEVEWQSMPTYSAFGNIHDSWTRLSDPDSAPEFATTQLIGSPATVAAAVRQWVDAGFDRIILQCPMPGVPRAEQRAWIELFAKEVAPQFTGLR